jgi:hypothetical protein
MESRATRDEKRATGIGVEAVDSGPIFFVKLSHFCDGNGGVPLRGYGG